MPRSRSRLKTADLTHRAVVITGAGSGIRRELALCDINDAGMADTVEAARTLGAQVPTSRSIAIVPWHRSPPRHT